MISPAIVDRLVTAGRPLSEAKAAMILLHGRGSTAESILTLADQTPHPEFAYLAPAAVGRTWYPLSFLAPIAQNEPALSKSLAVVAGVLALVEQECIAPDRTILLGFSQGACLALEFVARHARRYGAVVGLTGGLIGAPGTPRVHAGSLESTPVFLGAGDPDPHVPWWRVEETAQVLSDLGAGVTLRRFPGMGNLVNEEELAAVRRLMAEVGSASEKGRN